jgi:hypothetical protein
MPTLLERAGSYDQTIGTSPMWDAKEGTNEGISTSDHQRHRDGISLEHHHIGFLLSTTIASAQLVDKKGLTLEAAKKVAAAAEEEAMKNKWTVVIAIVDEGGNLVYVQRLDETQIGSIEVAIQKAKTSASFKQPTKALEDAVMTGGRTVVLKPAGSSAYRRGLAHNGRRQSDRRHRTTGRSDRQGRCGRAGEGAGALRGVPFQTTLTPALFRGERGKRSPMTGTQPKAETSNTFVSNPRLPT